MMSGWVGLGLGMVVARGGDYRGDGGDANVNVPPPLIAHLVILLTFV